MNAAIGSAVKPAPTNPRFNIRYCESCKLMFKLSELRVLESTVRLDHTRIKQETTRLELGLEETQNWIHPLNSLKNLGVSIGRTLSTLNTHQTSISSLNTLNHLS